MQVRTLFGRSTRSRLSCNIDLIRQISQNHASPTKVHQSCAVRGVCAISCSCRSSTPSSTVYFVEMTGRGRGANVVEKKVQENIAGDINF